MAIETLMTEEFKEQRNKSQKSTLEKLLDCSDMPVEVFKSSKGNYCINFKDATVYDGVADIGVFGCGATLEEATRDYINRISGKKLRFGSGDNFATFIYFMEN